jgi:BTB/POZ domain
VYKLAVYGPDSDITIQSSDGMNFHVHKSNLDLSSAGFAPSEFNTADEVVQFTETSTTLNILFKFCYPERHPDLTTLKFEVLAPLAEAAQKYEVFSAMNICKICMQYVLDCSCGCNSDS